LPCFRDGYISGLVIFKCQNWHQDIKLCLRARTTNMSKLAPNYLKTNSAFTTCCWNNVKGFYLVHFSIWKTPFFLVVVEEASHHLLNYLLCL
jgi:hypothetical protein